MEAYFEAFPILQEVKVLAEKFVVWVLANVFVVAPLLQLITIGLIFLVVLRLFHRVFPSNQKHVSKIHFY